MSDLYWLMTRRWRVWPVTFASPLANLIADDRRVFSGIIFINRNGLRWRDAPREYGPHKALYNRWKRWSDKGVLARIMFGLAAEHGEEKTVRTPLIVCCANDCRAMDRGYDADWVREALQHKSIGPCIPGRKARAIRQPQIQATQSHRDHVRQTERLAPRRNALRQMFKGLPVCNRTRRNRHSLVLRPEPTKSIIKVKLGELGGRQVQAAHANVTSDEKSKVLRRAHWVQDHFIRNRAGGISWRNPHVRGAGPFVE